MQVYLWLLRVFQITGDKMDRVNFALNDMIFIFILGIIFSIYFILHQKINIYYLAVNIILLSASFILLIITLYKKYRYNILNR